MTDTNTEWTEATNGAEANANDEWQEVEAEQQIAVEFEGDGFVARLMEIDPPNANGIIQSHWSDVYNLNNEWMLGSAFFNLTRDLVNKLKKVPPKSIVRIQWTSSLNTGHSSGTPMRVYDVRWKRG